MSAGEVGNGPLSRRALLRNGAATSFVSLAMAARAIPAAASAGEQSGQANPAPLIVPAVQEWTGGAGRAKLGPQSRIVVDPGNAARLRQVAGQLAADLQDMAGWKTPIVEGAPRSHDITLDLDDDAHVGPDTELARAEGYNINITDQVVLQSRTPTGVFWATRSLLQMLTKENQLSRTLPVGRIVDWPNHKIRGFMLDVGRRWFDESFIRDYIRYMSWFKYNTFQVHLNDNEIDPANGDWSKAYSAFRLASDNPRFEGLAAEDGAFTRAEWDRIQSVAAHHFVTVVPEIDAPAHARAFIEFDPSLGLNGGNSDLLDLSKPETTQFMKDVYSEFAPWFDSPVIHIGVDEYPSQHEQEYRAYFNEISEHVRSLGKEVYAWGSLSAMAGGGEGYDRDVTMLSWNNQYYGPREVVEDGYPMININDALLYIVPFASYYHGQGLDGRWLYANWELPVFAGDQRVDPNEPLLHGAMSAVWNDLVDEDYDETDVHGLVEPTFGLLAQKMWRGQVPGQSYDDFMAGVSSLDVGPGVEKLTSTLPNGRPGRTQGAAGAREHPNDRQR